jgi:hypothetical protein
MSTHPVGTGGFGALVARRFAEWEKRRGFESRGGWQQQNRKIIDPKPKPEPVTEKPKPKAVAFSVPRDIKTPEQKAEQKRQSNLAYRERTLAKNGGRTEADRAKARARYERWKAKLTPEQKAEHQAKKTALNRKWVASLDPVKLAERNRKKIESQIKARQKNSV